MVSRRQFNQLAAYFSLGSLVPSAVSQLFNFNATEAEIQQVADHTVNTIQSLRKIKPR